MDTSSLMKTAGNLLAKVAQSPIIFSSKKVGKHWVGTTAFVSRNTGEGRKYVWGKAPKDGVSLTPVQELRQKLAKEKGRKEKSAVVREVRQSVGGRLRVKDGVVFIGGRFAKKEIKDKVL